MLRLSDLSVSYGTGHAQTTPISSLNASFLPGSTAITGPSGSGKSTLMRVLAGIQQPSAGAATLDRRPLAYRGGVTDRRVSFIHQDYRLIDFLTVGENIQLASSVRGLSCHAADISNALSDVDLEGYADRWPATLSGGEQQRVAIARALALETRVVLADEPTGALDADNSRAVAQLLRRCAEKGAIVVVATHDADVASMMDCQFRLASGILCEVS
jgi:ABC-type lipoprotein export system ATPase subunit